MFDKGGGQVLNIFGNFSAYILQRPLP